MKKIIRILILCLGCIVACGLLPACSSAIEEPESGGGGDGSTVTLTIQAITPGTTTRADATSIPEQEQIDELRIIVVDKATNNVEYNSLLNFPNRDGSSYNIEVTKNGTKLVYFLANTEDLNLYLPLKGQTWNRTTVDYYVLHSLPENRLPFTSKYEIEVKEEDVAATCYIAIAAIKFSLDFTNNTGQEIEVNSLKISSIADCSYLLPHLDSKKDWDEWITSVTSNDNDSKPYITAYSIPEGTQHQEFEVKVENTTTGTGNGDGTDDATENTSDNSSFTVATSETYTFDPFYCHESKFILQGETEQHYSIQFEIGDKTYYGVIEGLESLIRSTHVIIHINLNELDTVPGNIVILGTITPWNEEPAVEGGLEEVTPEP